MKAVCVIAAVSALLAPGCGSVVRETHYFALSAEGAERPTEFYRLRVSGNTGFSQARFVAGYYDERAVDLLFDELRSSSTSESFETSLGELRSEDDPDRNVDFFDPDAGNGAFVLIQSTNVDAITQTISAFSQSRETANALTALVNRDTLANAEAMAAEAPARQAIAAARTRVLEDALTAAAQADGQSDAEEAYRRALSVLARRFGHSEGFASLDEARAFFAAREADILEDQ